MSDFDSVDFFTDASLIPDPYPYFDHVRGRCPILPQSHHGVVAVTGHAEALAVYKDPAFSSCVSVAGPFSGLPFDPVGDDVSALIEQHRSQIPMSEHIVTQDPPEHGRTRGLLSRLLTPKRLKENEEFMWRLADEQLDALLARGRCEFLNEYARPFSGLVIADLLGVPPEDHEEFRAVFSGQVVGGIEDDALTRAHNPLEYLNEKFSAHITERRREPRSDMLTELAQATYPDGSTPEVIDVGASNRDARKFEDPNDFRVDRRNVREHVAFGRGNHSCLGAPLARAEARISFNRILDRMSAIAVSETAHGSPAARRYAYEPTWQMRGLTELHLELTAIQH